ncbi:MAG: PAS domain-containing protein, partial [Deltaproteobacteria bacterium]|nr:PAS domain-containing protein [Deltaproteobacteria bacterium]
MSAINNIFKVDGERPVNRDAIRAVILILLLLVCMGMTYYAHFILHTGIVFSHFFYVPIVLAAYWWGRHAVWVGVFLGAWLLAIHLPSASEILPAPNLLRFGMFIVVGIVVGNLRVRALKIEKETKLAHAELDQIFNTTADAMFVIDKDFNVLRANETFSLLFGINKDQATGKKCYEVFRGPRCGTADCALKRILRGEERLEYDVEREDKDGGRITCILTAVPLREPDGELFGIIEDFKDITDRNQLLEKLEAAKTYAENIIANFLDTLIV